MPHTTKQNPWYPYKGVTWSNLYFFIKQKTFSVNPFDKASILEGKILILKEAREASPNYKMFLKAAILATGLSERTIRQLLYTKEHNEK